MMIPSTPTLRTRLAPALLILAVGSLALALLGPKGVARAEEKREEELLPGTGDSPEARGYFWVDRATVVAVDPEENTLTVTEPEGTFTYLVTPVTLLRKGGESVSLEDVQKGDQVAITFHQGQDVKDRPVANTVQVMPVDEETGEPARRR